MVESVGQTTLRQENVSSIVTGFALQEFKLKQLCMVDTSTSWIESYFKETKAELTGGTGSAVRGIPRGANFPYGEVKFTKVSSYIEKYGIETFISLEDARTDNIPVIARHLLRVGRAVAYAVDVQIESAISGATGINTLAITAGYEWDSATVAQRDPVKDILYAIKELQTDNYDPLNGNGYLVINPKQYANILMNSKVVNNPSFKTADVVSNGVVGQICGLKIIVSNTVTADQCYVVIAKEALTWKEAEAVTVRTITNEGIGYTIRAWCLGVCQVPNPEAICKITNTDA